MPSVFCHPSSLGTNREQKEARDESINVQPPRANLGNTVVLPYSEEEDAVWYRATDWAPPTPAAVPVPAPRCL
ncbi:uncharacterized protein UV8b_06856 [Ustilaginoidea virens]|uniref:Uncharacterized protein n=1 Tax=Ustilaginoidea virens TaxID=1159556 RepID=A0A8E5HVX3_USTVR|nr:uncharacterized protein UV8b_06856 [Ustilaginoidea virens]QUC22615.1 hypothetical protein UV8b_06856 [Ustilaginoidea virens]